MRKTKAFTLIELLVVISIIALLIGILLPALGAARRTARQMKGTTQVRGIQQSLVIYAQTNNQRFPGLDRDGVIETSADYSPWTVQAAAEQTGATPANRFQILLEDDYFAGEYAISPAESKTEYTSPTVTTANFSYALRAFNTAAGGSSAWKADEDGDKEVVSDRRIDNTDSTGGYRSVHTAPALDVTEWKGSVSYNDGHADFLATDPAGLVDVSGSPTGAIMAYSNSNSSE